MSSPTDPGAEELPKLPYLGAVIAETLRMHPTVSIVVRQLTCPATTWQTERSPGDVIGVALPALHADPHVWPDPGRFDPERFLLRKPARPSTRRSDTGTDAARDRAFASLELAIVLGTILTNVELRIPTRSATAQAAKVDPARRRRRPQPADHAQIVSHIDKYGRRFSS